MKIACVYLEHFAVAVERWEDSSIADRPVIIGGLPHERRPVYDFSPLAAEWGVKPGMPLRQAHELCPLAVFLPPDEVRYRKAFSDVVDVLEVFSPYVEDESLGLAYLEVSGMEGLHGNDRTLAHKIARAVEACFGVAPRLGLAGSKFAARIGALCSSPGEPVVIAPGSEREFLAPLPVSILPCSERMKLRLHRFGVDTAGHFASLPANEVIFQFEEEGRVAHRLARGVDDRLVVPRQVPPTIVQRVEYDYRVESVEQILWSVDRPLKRAIGELEKSYRLCQEIRLHLTFDNGEAWYDKTSLREPAARQRDIVDAIRRIIGRSARHQTDSVSKTESVSPPFICKGESFWEGSAPTSLTLILAGLGGEKGRQLNLFTDIKRGQSLHRSIGELQRKLGQDCIKYPVIVDPLARLPERRFAYRSAT
ncbi:MAG: hypothetical protein HYX94_12900 [Chloroflexi bacterium]|nr:hypothetical protein [Chloroflexota bacterium]